MFSVSIVVLLHSNGRFAALISIDRKWVKAPNSHGAAGNCTYRIKVSRISFSTAARTMPACALAINPKIVGVHAMSGAFKGANRRVHIAGIFFERRTCQQCVVMVRCLPMLVGAAGASQTRFISGVSNCRALLIPEYPIPWALACVHHKPSCCVADAY